jgi:hypothetical protein
MVSIIRGTITISYCVEVEIVVDGLGMMAENLGMMEDDLEMLEQNLEMVVNDPEMIEYKQKCIEKLKSVGHLVSLRLNIIQNCPPRMWCIEPDIVS